MRFVLFVLVVSACGKSATEAPPPTCTEVIEHILEITKKQLPGHDYMVTDQRDGMIMKCESGMSPATRRCVKAATTLAEIEKCKPDKPDPAVERPRRPLPKRGSN